MIKEFLYYLMLSFGAALGIAAGCVVLLFVGYVLARVVTAGIVKSLDRNQERKKNG